VTPQETIESLAGDGVGNGLCLPGFSQLANKSITQKNTKILILIIIPSSNNGDGGTRTPKTSLTFYSFSKAALHPARSSPI